MKLKMKGTIMKYLIKAADKNGNTQTEIKCNEQRLEIWIKYLIQKGFTAEVTKI